MKSFAVAVIQETEQDRLLPRSVVDQLIRAATSVGANYAEACNAASRADFRNKVFIAKKEAAETRYWLDIVIELSADGNYRNLRQESQELLMILQAIINSLKGGPAK